MLDQSTCRQCNQSFIIEQEDLKFYDRISPVFNGKKYQIPPPALCPNCRDARRYSWRNERHLYKRKCAKSGKEIISMYSPDSEYIVWDKDEWHKDDWDPLDFGQDYNLSRSFFKQFDQMIKKIPRPAITLYNHEKCDFCNFVWDSKNCYLCFGSKGCENCLYSSRLINSIGCVDCQELRECQLCYECIFCMNCYNCQNCEKCFDSRGLFFCYDCRGSSDMFMCTGIRNKQYYIRNKQYTKDEYLKMIKNEKIGLYSKREKLVEEFKFNKKKSIRLENDNLKCENCTGNYLIECKNCHECYSLKNVEDSKFAYFGTSIKNCYDFSQVVDLEFCYEVTSGSGYKNIFCAWPVYGDNNYYCNFCENCSNCFGCFGLKHKKFCILNKQYSEEEYSELVPKIIEKMLSNNEWGEFFPYWTSPFCYNESMADIYHPKTKEEAVSLGAKWRENDHAIKYVGLFYVPKNDISEYKDDDEKKKLLQGVIKCNVSGKPFKIMPQELVFYMENQIPMPMKHYDIRFKERFSLINPRKLYHRECMCEERGHGHSERCETEFETTYAPDRPEKVYCEKCYQQSML